jgi:hypothetical protein
MLLASALSLDVDGKVKRAPAGQHYKKGDAVEIIMSYVRYVFVDDPCARTLYAHAIGLTMPLAFSFRQTVPQSRRDLPLLLTPLLPATFE